MMDPQTSRAESSSKTDNGKRFVRTLSRTVDNAVLLALLVALMFATYALWDTHKVVQSANAEQFSTYKPTVEETKSFEELRALNSDVIGWLTIYDTSIDYPLLRCRYTDNDYLSKNALGEWEGSGSLFLDFNNKPDFSDFNTIIFGHHMAGPAMFGELDSFLDKSFFEEHEYANLFYSDTGLALMQNTYDFETFHGTNHGLQFFAMCQADGYDTAIYGVPSTTSVSKQEALKAIADRALLARNLNTGEVKLLGKAGPSKPTKVDSVTPDFFGITENDRIVLMSTCSADITNGRFVLVGKILDHEVPNPFPEEEEATPPLLDHLLSFMNRLLGLPLWGWILILVAVIFLLGLLYHAERQRLRKKQERKLRAQEAQKD